MKKTPFSSQKRQVGSVPTGSLADIAFLLLIFFLVATTIVEDKGILVKLPEWQKDLIIQNVGSNNILNILINADNNLLVEGKPAYITELRESIINFILNPSQDPSKADRPDKAVISLQNDRGTHYEQYMMVYNEIVSAYKTLWDAEAIKEFGTGYNNCSRAQKREIRSRYPQVISEAEPTNYGEI